jgi:hypothetical protein
VLVVTPYLLLLLGAIVPRVEDPLPDEIGLSVVLILAGTGGILGVLFTASTQERREQAANRGGAIGFGIGLAIYLLALVVQVTSSL